MRNAIAIAVVQLPGLYIERFLSNLQFSVGGGIFGEKIIYFFVLIIDVFKSFSISGTMIARNFYFFLYESYGPALLFSSMTYLVRRSLFP